MKFNNLSYIFNVFYYEVFVMQIQKSNDNSVNGFPTKDGLLDMAPALNSWVNYGNDKFPSGLSKGKTLASGSDKNNKDKK